MAQTYVGPNYGLHAPLRDNTEVWLTHANGDPDRPLILGATDGEANEAAIPSLVLPNGSRKHWAATTWTLIERIADSGGGIPEEPRPAPVFAMSAEPCPRSGLWSPRADVPIADAHIQQGKPMPMAEWRDRDGTLQRRAIQWQWVQATA